MNYSRVSSVNGSLLVSAFSLQTVFIVSGNLLTILTFIRSPHLRKRSMYMVINLSVADFLVGLIPSALFTYILGSYYFSWSKCPRWITAVQEISDIWLSLVSITTLTVVSIERMYATLWPLSHRSRGGWVVHTVAIFSTWAVSAAIAVLHPLVKHNYIQGHGWILHIPITMCLILIIIMGASYAAVFYAFKRQQNNVANTGNANQPHSSRVREKKLIITLLVVTSTSLALWLPFALVNFTLTQTTLTHTAEMVFAFKLLHYANSGVNVLIYAARMREFRTALIRLLCTCS